MGKRFLKLYPLGLLFLGLAVVSCGGPTKEEQAVARLRDRQKSAFVRIVNLTDAETEFKIAGRTLVAKVESERSSVFLANPAGATKVESALLTSPISINLKAKDEVSVFLMGAKGSVTGQIVTGEPRLVSEGKALVTFVCADPEGKYIVKTQGSTDIALEPFKASASLDLSPGDFNATVTGAGGAEAPVQIRTQERGAYTVVVYRKNGELTILILNNHPDLNVSAMGTAAG